jgi:2,3-bisphosphoglycerate-independent phosphoglycerate mutase
LRGSGLGANVSGTSPEKLGVPPTRPIGKDSESLATAKIVEKFITEAARTLDEKSPANMLTLTDFARCPVISPMSEIYGIRCVAIAIYPLYKGIARLVGMDIPNAGPSLGDQIETLRRLWGDYDFFYLHYKYADSAGCDGNFTAKVEMIERLDTEIPKIRALEPDVLIVTGDHSTPSSLRKRSWHPVPTLLWSQTCRPDQVVEFGESYCLHGGLGQLPAKHLLRLALAHSGRFGILGE